MYTMRQFSEFVTVRLWPVLCLMVILFFSAGMAQGQTDTELTSAEQSFKFVAGTLQNYTRSGELESALGLDASDIESFIGLLRESYREFTRNFSPDSPFCSFYNDPNNAIMEIEERAGLGFQFLPAVASRQQRFVELDQQFQQGIRSIAGEGLLTRVNTLKKTTESFEYLPARTMDPAQTINFADTACR